MKGRIVKKFEDEIQELDRELKTVLPQEMKRALEHGDLRENGEYQAAKERQSFLQARIGMLKKRVAEISLMNFDKLPRNKAAFGSTVHVRENGGQMFVYQIVMPEESDAGKGWISSSSPIGRALLGKEEGDMVSVPTPNGTRVFEIAKLVTVHQE